MSGYLEQLGGALSKGGAVVPPLVICAALLFFGLGYRWVMLHARGRALLRETAAVGRTLLADDPKRLRHRLDELFFARENELGKLATLVRSVAGVAPLLGLLGTVTGMIETFDSLGDATFISSSAGGIAGGISEALYSTELGLVVAVPGLLLGGLLDRRQNALSLELAKLKDRLIREVHA